MPKRIPAREPARQLPLPTAIIGHEPTPAQLLRWSAEAMAELHRAIDRYRDNPPPGERLPAPACEHACRTCTLTCAGAVTYLRTLEARFTIIAGGHEAGKRRALPKPGRRNSSAVTSDEIRRNSPRTTKEPAMNTMSPAPAIIIVNDCELTAIDHNGERVLTFAMIDRVHGRPDGTAGRNFRDNRERMIEGKHYFRRNSSEAAAMGFTAPNGLTLMTERGYFMLVKSFTDDLAWHVQDQLVEAYFTRPAANPALSDFASVLQTQIKTILPALVKAELSGGAQVVRGLTSLQIAEKAGYAKGQRPRGLTQFITGRCRSYHQRNGIVVREADYGSAGERALFDHDATGKWLDAGGRTEIENYVSKRKGQGNLHLVQP
jgi:hypothetical protein